MLHSEASTRSQTTPGDNIDWRPESVGSDELNQSFDPEHRPSVTPSVIVERPALEKRPNVTVENTPANIQTSTNKHIDFRVALSAFACGTFTFAALLHVQSGDFGGALWRAGVAIVYGGIAFLLANSAKKSDSQAKNTDNQILQ